MTPLEKAKELIEAHGGFEIEKSVMNFEKAKKHALITLSVIMSVNLSNFELDYFKKVKQIIENYDTYYFNK